MRAEYLFSKLLKTWYLKNQRDLPWRNTKDAYIIWLSEIILQQTKVSQGTAYFLKIREEYPNVHLLANAEETEILKLWQGLGYYSRARNLHKTAILISKEFKGIFPDTYQELIKLYGVGDYTASAIASICFGEATPTVDGNVFRFLARYFGVFTPINSSKGFVEFKNIAKNILDIKNPGNHNQAMMEFGALICTPKNPKCEECPFSDSCYGNLNRSIELLPQKNKKIKIRKRYFNYLVIMSTSRRTIIQQRIKKDIWKNLYEFPLLETMAPLNVKELMKSEMFQSLLHKKDYHVIQHNSKLTIHKLTHQNLYCTFWIVESELENYESISWEDIHKYPVPTLIQNFIEEYEKRELIL